jgi:hypothetical protein
MSKITFINCKVTANNKEQNYTDFHVELESIESLNLNTESRLCIMKMKDGTGITVQYYAPNNVVM